MAGTARGGQRAAATNLMRYGANFYKTIGAMGGRVSRGGGFTDRELAKRAGAIGGRKSSRRARTEAHG